MTKRLVKANKQNAQRGGATGKCLKKGIDFSRGHRYDNSVHTTDGSGITTWSMNRCFADRLGMFTLGRADFLYKKFNNAVSRRYHVIDDAEGVPVKTGARELLQWARDNAYTIGLASSTRQAVVEKELSERGLLPYFDYVLGGDRIARSKPAPDIYETACRALHAVPADTYAIEDSYNGIRAAHAAGMRPIMVPDLLPPTQEMYTLAAHIFPNLTAFHEFLKRQSTHSLPR